jgi:hypothetical protein
MPFWLIGVGGLLIGGTLLLTETPRLLLKEVRDVVFFATFGRMSEHVKILGNEKSETGNLRDVSGLQ